MAQSQQNPYKNVRYMMVKYILTPYRAPENKIKMRGTMENCNHFESWHFSSVKVSG